MESQQYVTNAGWLRQVARVDAVDVVADEFERPVAPGTQAFWTPDSTVRWPRSARGWRSWDLARAHGADGMGAHSTA